MRLQIFPKRGQGVLGHKSIAVDESDKWETRISHAAIVGRSKPDVLRQREHFQGGIQSPQRFHGTVFGGVVHHAQAQIHTFGAAECAHAPHGKIAGVEAYHHHPDATGFRRRLFLSAAHKSKFAASNHTFPPLPL
jgi:hypothetical protein